MKALSYTPPFVSVDWLAAHQQHPDLLILDARLEKTILPQNEAYKTIQLPNALFFDIKGVFSDTTTTIPNMLVDAEAFTKACQDLGIKKNHHIIVYDQVGMYSSARVWWMFKCMGHHNISILDGGLPAWVTAGLPCEPFSSIPKKERERGDFKATYHPELVVDAKVIAHAIIAEDTLIIDARSNDRFTGTKPEPRAGVQSGHMPNAVNLPFLELFHEGKLRTTKELNEIFTALVLDSHKKLIYTCGSGVTACILFAVAYHLGYTNMAVYDGSWSEWGQLPNVPITC